MPTGITSGPGAVVLQEQMNPIALAMNIKAQQDKQVQYQAAQQLKVRTANNRMIAEYSKYDPGKVFEPFAKELQGDMKQYSSFVQGIYNSGADPAAFGEQIKNMQSEMTRKAAKTEFIKEEWQNIEKEIKAEGSFLDKEILLDRRNALLYDQPLNTINSNTINQQVFGDLTGGAFRADDYAAHVVSNAEETIIKQIVQTEMADASGDASGTAKKITELKSKLYMINPNTGKPMLDENDQKIINVDADVVSAYMENPSAARYIDQTLALSNVKKGDKDYAAQRKSLIEAQLSPYAYEQNVLAATEYKERALSRTEEQQQQLEQEVFTLSEDIAAGDEDAIRSLQSYKIDADYIITPHFGGTPTRELRVSYKKPIKNIMGDWVFQDKPIVEYIDLNDPESAREIVNVINAGSPGKFHVSPARVNKYFKGKKTAETTKEGEKIKFEYIE